MQDLETFYLYNCYGSTHHVGQFFTSRGPLENICINDNGRVDGLTVFPLLRFDLMTFWPLQIAIQEPNNFTEEI